MPMLRLPVAAVLTAATLSCLATPSTPGTLQIEEAVWAKSFQTTGIAAAYSPDGAFAASTVCDPARTAAEARGGKSATLRTAYHSQGCDIWLYPLAGGPGRNLTAGQGSSWAPAWSSKGEFLAFYSDRDGTPNAWLWTRADNTLRRISDTQIHTELGMDAPLWTEADRALVVKLRPEAASAPREGSQSGTTVTVFRSPRAAAGATQNPQLVARMVRDIGLIEVASGQTKRLAQGVYSLLPAVLSPDRRSLAYLDGREPAPPGLGARAYTLVKLDLRTGQTESLARGILQGAGTGVTWSPNGRWIAYIDFNAAAYRPAPGQWLERARTMGDLRVVSTAGGTPRRFTGAPPNHFSNTGSLPPLWDARSRRLYLVGAGQLWQANVDDGALRPLGHDEARTDQFVVATPDRNQIWSPDEGRSLFVASRNVLTQKQGFTRVALESGRREMLLEEDKAYGGVYLAPFGGPQGRDLFYFAESAQSPCELWIASLDSRPPRRLTDLNPQLRERRLGVSRLMEFQSQDGRALQASLLLPPGEKPARGYPLVLWVYASEFGSASVNRFGLVGYPAFNLQMLATRGYAVMWPDIPVSLGTPMQDVMKAVMPAIDRAVALGFADPERLAVMGNSNGGYSVMSLIVQTKRFKAAVVNSGFADLTALYGRMGYTGLGHYTSWLEEQGGSMGVPPWQAPLRYIENSPIYHLDRIQTPVLIQAGEEDSGVLPGSDQIWVGLQRLGKEALYLRYGGEGHVLFSAANLHDYWQRLLAFLGEHVARGQ